MASLECRVMTASLSASDLGFFIVFSYVEIVSSFTPEDVASCKCKEV